jgi:hypothetical protein
MQQHRRTNRTSLALNQLLLHFQLLTKQQNQSNFVEETQ